MSESQKKKVNVWQLSPASRACAAILGLSLVALAILGIVWQFPTAVVRGPTGAVLRSSRNVAGLATMATTLFVAGVALLVYAINGVRLLRLGFGSVVAEGSPAAVEAKEHYDRALGEPAEQVEIEDEAPQPTEPPAAVLEAQEGTLAVFELTDVPARVIRDALSKWPPSAGNPPESLAEFQFASRKRGRGPHPWILKFNGRPEVRVSYGGRGKSEATVGRHGG